MKYKNDAIDWQLAQMYARLGMIEYEISEDGKIISKLKEEK